MRRPAYAHGGPNSSIPVIRAPSVPLIAKLVVYTYITRSPLKAEVVRAHGACVGPSRWDARTKKAQAVRKMQQGDARGGRWHGATPRSCIWLLWPSAASPASTYTRGAEELVRTREVVDSLIRYESPLERPCSRIIIADSRSTAATRGNHIGAYWHDKASIPRISELCQSPRVREIDLEHG